MKRTTGFFLTPYDKLPALDPYAANYDGNVFGSRGEAEAAIPSLRACDPEFDVEWAVGEYTVGGYTVGGYRRAG